MPIYEKKGRNREQDSQGVATEEEKGTEVDSRGAKEL